MAGSKETPRQKLIGLMYLVLLAMLALQVSSAIIQKFEQMNESITASIHQVESRNFATLESIERAVKKGKNKPTDVKVLKKAKELHQKTQSVVSEIRKTKEELIALTGGRDENGHLIGAKEEEPVAQHMLGAADSKNGKGYDIKGEINSHVEYINSLLKGYTPLIQYGPLAQDGEEDPLFKNDPEQSMKDFAHLNFESTPLVAALAVLSQKESDILSMESAAMDRLGTDVGASKLNVDKIRPVVKANSKRVVAGTKYEGEMFMAAFNSTFKPQMTFNGENIDPSSQGIAAISFKASGGNYDENGQSKRVWKGTITYPKADGTDTTYIVEEEYTVLKPTILTQTSEKPPLFRNSGNKVSIQVPALGADYNPEFQVSGGKIRNRQGTGNVTIIPTDPNAKVKIYNNGTYIGEEKFDVRLIPTPDILLKKGQADYTVNYIRGVPRSHLNALYVGVKPDKEFKKVCPNDAQYKFYEISATVVRNGIPRHSETLRHYQTFAALASHLNLGDNLIIEVKDLRRKNYLGEIERVNIPSTVFNLPIR